MFLVTRYYVKWDKMAEYQKWLLSDEAKDLEGLRRKQAGDMSILICLFLDTVEIL